jgi:DNA-binding GntR family transcriptional regulator
VTILPRRGVVVNPLTLDEIRHLYEVIGALEGAVVVNVFHKLTSADFETMRRLNQVMKEAVLADSFDFYYGRNLAFHEILLGKSDNQTLQRTVNVLKQRLYDFPRKRRFIREWELASIEEHAKLVDLLDQGDANGAADFLRDVHWSFKVQEPFIHRYYFADGTGDT